PVPAGFALPDLPAAIEALPADLAAEVRAAYANLAAHVGEAEPAVAVRSSALDEDGAAASFAGQHATELNVRGAEAVLASIIRCCASARSEAALAYRAAHGLDADAIRVAVLVQHLVPAEAAGVAFSANPISGDRTEVVLNVAWGLGEAVVSGLVTPDMFVIDASDDLVVREIATKETMTVRTDAGTEHVAVPEAQRDAPSLTDAQAVELAHLARDLERRMGWPVDIEFAVADGVLHLLQCRPITTL
ncbi:MAG: PEP/pyruvate-binding domain-containing protein, partial [Dehalococcoidia bacterium]